MKINKNRLSPVHIKVLKFFQENPSCIDTSLGISLWTNENVKLIKKVLEDLASMKVLIAHRSPSTTGYSYTQDAAISKEVESIIKTLKKKI